MTCTLGLIQRPEQPGIDVVEILGGTNLPVGCNACSPVEDVGRQRYGQIDAARLTRCQQAVEAPTTGGR